MNAFADRRAIDRSRGMAGCLAVQALRRLSSTPEAGRMRRPVAARGV
jgi:hypothetical protein